MLGSQERRCWERPAVPAGPGRTGLLAPAPSAVTASATAEVISTIGATADSAATTAATAAVVVTARVIGDYLGHCCK